jgi:hypothetical protein
LVEADDEMVACGKLLEIFFVQKIIEPAPPARRTMAGLAELPKAEVQMSTAPIWTIFSGEAWISGDMIYEI